MSILFASILTCHKILGHWDFSLVAFFEIHYWNINLVFIVHIGIVETLMNDYLRLGLYINT